MRVIGIAGWSGAGKTTLIKRLLPALIARGLRVSTVKHAHHNFDVDYPGKDSYEHRTAGATEVLVTSDKRWALMHELRDSSVPPLRDLLRILSPVDIVLVEGFKGEERMKLEVYRSDNEKPLLFPETGNICAVVSDVELADASVPVLDRQDIEKIADAIEKYAEPLELWLS